MLELIVKHLRMHQYVFSIIFLVIPKSQVEHSITGFLRSQTVLE